MSSKGNFFGWSLTVAGWKYFASAYVFFSLMLRPNGMRMCLYHVYIILYLRTALSQWSRKVTRTILYKEVSRIAYCDFCYQDHCFISCLEVPKFAIHPAGGLWFNIVTVFETYVLARTRPISRGPPFFFFFFWKKQKQTNKQNINMEYLQNYSQILVIEN